MSYKEPVHEDGIPGVKFVGAQFAVSITTERDGRLTFRIFTEDDENWFKTDVVAHCAWLKDLATVCEAAAAHYKEHKIGKVNP